MPTPITFGALSARAFGFLGKLRAITDAYFKYVTLLLHGNGTNGAQNNTFLDGSTNAFTITRNGNTTQGSFSPFSQTGWSNYFDGTGDYLTAPSNAAFDFGTGDFTIEFFVYWQNISTSPMLFHRGSSTTGWFFQTSATTAYFGSLTSNRYTTWTVSLSNNTWTHIALTRTGNSLEIFVNGVSQTAKTVTGAELNNDVATDVWIADFNAATPKYPLQGYLSNYRIVKGSRVYTANFTPPTAPLTAITNTSLLTCQSNRFIDNSSNAFAITRNGDVRVEAFSPFNPSTTYSTANVGGSGYFDGTGDYLQYASNAAFEFGTGNFTIEFWWYPQTLSTTQPLVYHTNDVGVTGTGEFAIVYNTSLGLRFYINAGTVDISQGSTSGWSINQWYHVVFVRDGNTLTIYRNGVSIASGSVTGTTIGAAVVTQIGGESYDPLYSTGYISNYRVVKGTAVYTSAFTPPTSPLTAITNTSLLLNFTNGGIFDNASQTVLETVGNAQISTAQSKFGGGSMYFDGTGDWLTASDRPAQRFGTADFTVEGWLYLAATGAARGLISKGTATTGWSVNVTSGNKLQFSYTASNLTGTSSLSASTWYYFTAMRTGGSIRVYLNGTQEVTNSTAITDNFNQTNILYVGANRTGGDALNGYLDDIRITNGYARYNNFTPSTTALTPTAYTAALPNTSTTNGAQNNTFLDGSTNNFTITRNGNTTQGTFSPFSNSGWSNYFDGTGDYLNLTLSSATSTTFTVECWVYLTAYPSVVGGIISTSLEANTPEAWYLRIGTSPGSNSVVEFGETWGANAFVTTASVPLNTWTHIAAVRNGSGSNNAKIYINGVDSATGTFSRTYTSTSLVIGRNFTATNNYYLTGYVSNLRYVSGTAVYTSAFTPPTAPLTAITNTSLLTCQSNRFIDNSTNAFAITRNGDVSIQAYSPFTPAAYSSSTNGGSGYFDGTGDFLNLGGQSAFAFGTNDFTVEMWIYPLATGAQALYGSTPATTDGAYLTFALNASNNLTVYVSAATRITGSVVATVGQWTHVAVCRSGTSTRLFVNGNQDGITWTDTTSYLNGANRPVIGTNSYTTTIQNFNGYISNARVVNGTAVYTANFTPPTAPLTAITNTSLLLNFTNAGIFDAVGINNYETVGNAQASTTQAKFGTTSMYFDGTGDWLTAPDRPVNQLRAGNFTIEGWFYLSATGAARGLVSKGTSTTGWSVNITSGDKLQFSYTSSNLTGATTLAASTWYHFAVVRSGGTVQIYLNGVQDAISSSAITTDFNQTNILYIGANRTGGDAMNGYIDDLRITPGQALYPGNFTPPTAPFPNN